MKEKKYSKKNIEKLKAYLQNNKADDLKPIRTDSTKNRRRPSDNKNDMERFGNG